MGWPAYCSPPKNELTQLTPLSLQLELGDPTLEHDVLDKVNLSGYTKWDSEDQQELRRILSKYADIFANDDPMLGQTSDIKHKITLKEEAKLIKEQYGRVPPWLYDEVQKHLQEMIDVGAI